MDEDEREEIRNEWIAHVLEYGEVLNREDGMFSQRCSFDIGIVVCKKIEVEEPNFCSRAGCYSHH